MIDFKALIKPFPPAAVSWRVGSTNGDKSKGMALAYIDARDVMDRLDDVCGPAGWECRYPHTTGKTVCEISIWCDDKWVTKSDGAGDTDVEKEKGALSDAFKRAAVRWGIGRYLYHLPSPWVDLEAKGRSYIIKPTEMAKLKGLLGSQQQSSQKAIPGLDTRPQAVTLNDRADKLILAINASKDVAEIDKTWMLASGLCAQLDTSDPEKLVAITKLYDDRRHEISRQKEAI